MPFECIGCGQDTFSIIASIELPPDNRSDEISLQLAKCSLCGFKGLVVYEESRRGSLMADCWDHYGYHIRKSDFQKCLAWIKSCPNPRHADCDCPIHRIFNKRDKSGRWIGLDAFELSEPFQLKRGAH
jgi:hypothetical protein